VKIVIALGGNALLRRSGPTDLAEQQRNVALAARSIASIAPGNQVIVTHGNGPQVGLLALLDASAPASQRSTLDVLGAETEGQIGYLLDRELMNALGHARVATLLTQVEVDPKDPAFGQPTKFIGPGYDEAQARHLAGSRGWQSALDGNRWRRVVASPEPLRILECEAIEQLVHAGFVTICAGGGGVPVIRTAEGRLTGVECVVDKDRSSALLATALGADTLLMLTDVDAVYANWGRDDARPLRHLTPTEIEEHAFAAGSMGPKVDAARRFAASSGKRAYIGSLDKAADILAGTSGTLIAE
jgi:carbamate kinase